MLVLIPAILKVLLNVPFKLELKFIIIIEVHEHPEESRQLISILADLIVGAELVDHGNELAHDVGEDGHSKHQAKCYENTLCIAPRGKVSEAHGGQRGEGKVEENYLLLIRAHFSPEFIKSDEVLRLILAQAARWPELVPVHDIGLNLEQQLEKHCEEITTRGDEHHDLESLDEK
jgi:hypothetical protein